MPLRRRYDPFQEDALRMHTNENGACQSNRRSTARRMLIRCFCHTCGDLFVSKELRELQRKFRRHVPTSTCVAEILFYVRVVHRICMARRDSRICHSCGADFTSINSIDREEQNRLFLIANLEVLREFVHPAVDTLWK